MADDEVQGLVVKVGVDDNLFSQGISKINKSMNVLRSEFNATASNLTNFGTVTDQLKNKAEYLSKSMQLQEAKIKALKDAYEKAKDSTGEYSDATQNASVKLNNAITAFNKMEKELKSTQEQLEESEKSINNNGSVWDKLKDKILGSMKDIGESIKNGIGLSIGHDIWGKFKEGTASILTFGSEYQKAMNSLQASTGLSDKCLKSMQQTMTDIYNDNFGESFDDIGEGLKTVQQGWKGNSAEIKGLTENALLLRDTFGYEVDESFRSANMLVQQFGISGQDAYNLIAQGAQSGLDKNGDLLDTLNEYPVEFKSLGLNAQDMFNILQNGASAGGFSIDKMGDAIKEFSLRAKDGSSSTQQAFQQLGLNAQATMAKFAQGGDTAKQAFQEVNSKLLSMKDPLKQNQIGTALWGSMWEDLQKKGIASLTNLNGGIKTTKDSLSQMNKVKYNDLGSAFEGIKRNLQTGILLPLSQQLLPKLSDFSNWFTAHMPQIKQDVGNAVNAIIPIIEGIGKAFGFVKDNASWLIPVLAGLVGTITTFNIILSIVELMAAWNKITAAVTAAQAALNLTMSMNPIGLVIIAIGLLVAAGAALYMNWDKVSKFLSTCWSNIKNVAMTVFNGIKDFLSKWGLDILTVVAPFIGIPLQIIKHWGQIKDFFENLKNAIKQKLHDMFNFQLPHIKLPHFSIQGSFSLSPPSIPHLAVDWYAKGGIFNSPSIIGVGDASSPEAVVPLDKLQGFIDNAIQKNNGATGGGEYIFTIPLYLDGREVARGTAKYTAEELSKLNRNKFK